MRKIILSLLMVAMTGTVIAHQLDQGAVWLNMTEDQAHEQAERWMRAHAEACQELGGRMSGGGFAEFGKCLNDGQTIEVNPTTPWWVEPVPNPDYVWAKCRAFALYLVAAVAVTLALVLGIMDWYERRR